MQELPALGTAGERTLPHLVGDHALLHHVRAVEAAVREHVDEHLAREGGLEEGAGRGAVLGEPCLPALLDLRQHLVVDDAHHLRKELHVVAPVLIQAVHQFLPPHKERQMRESQ